MAGQTHDTRAEAIRSRLHIPLEKTLLRQHLDVPVDGALGHSGRGDKLEQRRTGVNGSADLTQDQAGSADCALSRQSTGRRRLPRRGYLALAKALTPWYLWDTILTFWTVQDRVISR